MGGPRGAPRAMSVHRFHVPEAAPGARVALPEHSAHHARDVLRLRPGAAVRVFDGAGAEFDAQLDSVSRQGVSARITDRAPARPESPLTVVLAVSPLRGDRMELVIQKATELGVAGSRQERWDKVESGAAEQSGRAVVPLVAPTTTLPALLAAPFDGLKLLFLERSAPSPLSALPRPERVLMVVGPAGGWEDAEVEQATAAGFVTAGLGPRILRAETAALAALSAVQVLWGDLG
ncbi:MAG: 16S rRNA (uracil(1498)-N(3))-methyltransferase [Acidobacteria bacterium]|nr:MAG: 16S rRNA (uracil(1498)-N(3))-methyltransferase [Acidobacteriota bacterium]